MPSEYAMRVAIAICNDALLDTSVYLIPVARIIERETSDARRVCNNFEKVMAAAKDVVLAYEQMGSGIGCNMGLLDDAITAAEGDRQC